MSKTPAVTAPLHYNPQLQSFHDANGQEVPTWHVLALAGVQLESAKALADLQRDAKQAAQDELLPIMHFLRTLERLKEAKMKDPLDAGSFRQGDCFLVKVDALPDGLQDITPDRGRVVLMAGEATGHHHAFYDRGVRVFAPAGSPKGTRPTHLQVVKTTALLRHEEHTEARIPPGVYRMPTQVEHTDDDEPRVVED